ncbi:class I SAM-dependent methyltransferase [Aetokthonos hydrillicola Thurmond2011]|jgi:SAM-dependent methyltransferase|uniref:Class I SAM-dependent methyltransferase n=1 Tax=Aetokthonos hydrillicola Thurmond2011 TaxID=2712845 RepID=A0AAP5I584_9CYAN|nr:class I SAM-dependent methyltransferase [Aetokthonos hydrillicola]MBO3458946.1 class I SAM-dependent methyltransferase [Aetokthonos hydrillicola CCALA 1050]MBW4589053.1 class I SAM-dependent methyltransferase [Aetokthonos hydrillicola CCALA 1050]MDR9894991.1 class I SAM-dependent methyltransferase [Aetokthonos hydrillicola Thurmond2011]
MSVFHSYARYYDLLYRDKDYYGESNFIHQLIQTHASNAHDILELGCGTGIHAIELAKQGYKIQGVDFSDRMLERAYDRLGELPPDLASRLKFYHGDIRHLRINQTFDVIISLFHVICYQTTNEDLLAAFATVKEHLKPGGIFIFDVWYGPAVLSDRPTVRVKRLEDEEIQVTRIAEPVMYANENWVDVNYQVFIKDKSNHAVEELWETHRMRYLFKPEIELLFQRFQMEIIDFREWMSDHKAGFDTWSTYFVGRG